MSPESEHLTRQSRIDLKLGAARWTVVPMSAGAAEGPTAAIEGFPTSVGPADVGDLRGYLTRPIHQTYGVCKSRPAFLQELGDALAWPIGPA